jgi:4Fe-4S single cluster domain
MLIFPTTLSIITTHKCTAACEDCCFGCNPKLAHGITPSKISEIINDSEAIESIRLVVFTGGEAFLLGDRLVELVTQVTKQRRFSRIVTNGFWATSKAAAEIRLIAMKKAGLGEINFSTGPEHQKFVPIDRIANGVKAAASLGIQSAVMIELHDGAEIDMRPFESDEMQILIQQGKVVLKCSPWMSFTPGQDRRQSNEYREMTSQSSQGCGVVYNTITVTPNERLIACCGLTMEEIPELEIGDLRTSKITDLLRDTPDDILKTWIHISGPKAIFDYAIKLGIIENQDLPDHICAVCRCLYSNRDMVNELFKDGIPEPAMQAVQLYKLSCLIPKPSRSVLLADFEIMKSVSNWKTTLDMLEKANCKLQLN